MKRKRNGEPRTVKGRILKLFAKAIVGVLVLLCLLFFCLMAIMRDYNKTIDHIGLERMLTQLPKIPQSRRERFPEAEIEYEELKHILFGVVDHTRIESLFEATYIELYPPYCIVGKSIYSVVARVSFAEVIELYDMNGKLQKTICRLPET